VQEKDLAKQLFIYHIPALDQSTGVLTQPLLLCLFLIILCSIAAPTHVDRCVICARKGFGQATFHLSYSSPGSVDRCANPTTFAVSISHNLVFHSCTNTCRSMCNLCKKRIWPSNFSSIIFQPWISRQVC